MVKLILILILILILRRFLRNQRHYLLMPLIASETILFSYNSNDLEYR